MVSHIRLEDGVACRELTDYDAAVVGRYHCCSILINVAARAPATNTPYLTECQC